MALLFMDSFQHYATADLLEKWTTKDDTGGSGTIAIAPTAGRRSTGALRLSSSALNVTVVKGVASSGATAIIGAAFKISTLSTVRILGLYDPATNHDHCLLQAGADGSLTLFTGNAVIPSVPGAGGSTNLGASAGGVIAAGTDFYLEMKVVLHATTGSAVVRVNGTTVLTLTNIATSGGSVIWPSFWVGAGGSSGVTVDIGDLYALDGTGAAPWNDFLGDCRVDARFPTAAGATTGWTPSAGANWECVDDAAPNDDTDYTSAAAAALTDTFVVQDAPVVGATIYGIQHCLSAKKTDAGTASIAPVVRHSGVDTVGTDLNPATAYSVLLQVAQVNPGTGVAWTEAGFNAANFGYRRTA